MLARRDALGHLEVDLQLWKVQRSLKMIPTLHDSMLDLTGLMETAVKHMDERKDAQLLRITTSARRQCCRNPIFNH